jgi:hypothetical protein
MQNDRLPVSLQLIETREMPQRVFVLRVQFQATSVGLGGSI